MNTAAGASLVAVRLPAGAAWLQTVNDVWASGSAVLPLAPELPEAAVAAALDAFRPAALIDSSGTVPLDHAVPVEPGTATVIATSGSTGEPKGAVLSWAALHWSARGTLERIGADASDRWLSCLPLHHIAGLLVIVRSRLTGTAPVVHDKFSVDAVANAAQVNLLSLVPTMLRRLLDSGASLSQYKCVLLGGAAAGAQLLDDAAAAGVRVVTTYGMTETAGGCVYDGVPLDGISIDVGADSRIRIAGPVVFSGYRLRDDLTAAVLRDGWFRSEDLGRWTPDGRLEVLGRADDIIITGGEKVSATQLAHLLEQHPRIREAAVTGRPDAEWGQRVVAYVTVRGDAPTLDDVRSFVRASAPPWAAPREMIVMEELPRLPSGKIDRLAL